MLGRASLSPVRISWIGSHIPGLRESNSTRAESLQLSNEFIEMKLGILERAQKDPRERASDLCVSAVGTLDRAILEGIQLLCVVTQNPDSRIPHTAAIVHERLRLGRDVMTFDLSQGCAGYVHGLFAVAGLMDRLGLERAVLMTSDPYSEIVDPEDRDTALIFGDAATATLLDRRGPGFALVDAVFGTAPGTASCLRLDTHFRMDGRTVFMTAAREVPDSIHALLARCGTALKDVDLFLLHPGSLHLMRLLRNALEAEPSRAPFECAGYGNTVSSSIPLMMERRLNDKALERLILSGFGVGFSWGSCLVERVEMGE